MRLLENNDEEISVVITHREALMIVAVAREAVFGTRVPDFETRVGFAPRITVTVNYGDSAHE
ncbi:hypothetical protein [Rhizobium sp. BK602]|uniref:hypothetical protein n=1 Tax=Rhizobium sp. BK602 TaxID=2586986 RepID=UPI001614838C|nr:hypothetical protein [Rhizobium sp. BK602]MBB3610876.1 hypothetical protein [Rhizobium sp. BK602]